MKKLVGLALLIMSVLGLSISFVSCESDTGLAVMTGVRDGLQNSLDSMSYETTEKSLNTTEIPTDKN